VVGATAGRPLARRVPDPRAPAGTLADIPLLLTNPAYRARATAHVRRTDPGGLGAFWVTFDTLTPGQAAQACGPVLSKLRAITGRTFVAGLLGTAASSFRMPDILDGGILVARLPKGVLGEDACRLVGSLLLTGLWQAATARADVPEDARRDASVIVDETSSACGDRVMDCSRELHRSPCGP
jgi:hypothetical protein